MREPHLVHAAVDMQQFHGGSILTDFKKFAILMRFQKSWGLLPEGFIVDEICAGFSVAVGTFEGRYGYKQYQGYKGQTMQVHGLYKEILYLIFSEHISDPLIEWLLKLSIIYLIDWKLHKRLLF